MGAVRTLVDIVSEDIGIQEHINLVHGYRNTSGWITLATINDRFKQKHYKLSNILDGITELESLENVYISQNSFYKPQRRIENIRQLTSLYMDMDYYNTDLRKESVLYFLENDYFGSKIPHPSLIIDSGRGLYLEWLIEPVPYKVLPLWNAIQKHFYSVLKDLGADRNAIDPARVLRLVGSTNSKSNTMVNVIYVNEYRYSLKELQEDYLPELKPKKEKTKGRPKKIISLFNTYSLHHARILDLVKLCEIRKWNMTGYRELVLFLYRYWTLCYTCDDKKALEDAQSLNKQFKKPLRDTEVVKATKSAEKGFKKWNEEESLSKEQKKKLENRKGYNYTNESLIDLLGITEEEQEQLQTIIGTSEKYRRNNIRRTPRNESGLTKKQQELKNIRDEVIKLKETGLSYRLIASKLNLSLSKVQRAIKNI